MKTCLLSPHFNIQEQKLLIKNLQTNYLSFLLPETLKSQIKIFLQILTVKKKIKMNLTLLNHVLLCNIHFHSNNCILNKFLSLSALMKLDRNFHKQWRGSTVSSSIKGKDKIQKRNIVPIPQRVTFLSFHLTKQVQFQNLVKYKLNKIKK